MVNCKFIFRLAFSLIILFLSGSSLQAQCCQCSQGGVLVGCFTPNKCNSGQCSQSRCASNLGGNQADYDLPTCSGSNCIDIAACAALPIELGMFGSEYLGDQIRIFWTTLSEINNAGFYLEKSEDGSVWSTVGWVNGQGTRKTETEYEFFDHRSGSAWTMYRLRQIDYDGEEWISEIIATKVEESKLSGMRIYPIPVQDELRLFFDTEEVLIKIEVIDLAGRNMVFLGDGISRRSHALYLQGIHQGMYQIRVFTENNIFNSRIFKK